MVYQAEEDAKVFKAELSKAIARKDAESRKQTASLTQEHASAAENAASQIGALANEIERSERRVAALVSELERVGADAEAAIETQRAEAEAESSRALEEQAELHRMAIAECLVRERTKRAEVIDADGDALEVRAMGQRSRTLSPRVCEGTRKPPARSRPLLKSPGGAENAEKYKQKPEKNVNTSPPPSYSPQGAPGSQKLRLEKK